MKNRIYLLLTVLFTFGSITAQVDRSQQPNPGPAPKITLDQPVEFELANGLQVLLVENPF